MILRYRVIFDYLSFQKTIQNLAHEIEDPLKQLQDMNVHMVCCIFVRLNALLLKNLESWFLPLSAQALQEKPKDLYSENISEEDLSNLINIMKKQSEGIDNLTEMLRKDIRDTMIIQNAFA